LKRIRPQDPLWKLGDTYNISIGEGGLSLTPLEMADYIATIANNGTSFKPYLAKEIKNQQGEIIKTSHFLGFSPLRCFAPKLKSSPRRNEGGRYKRYCYRIE